MFSIHNIRHSITSILITISIAGLQAQSLVPFIDNGKFGFKNISDSIIVAPTYDYCESFIPGYSWTIVGLGVYNEVENQLLEPEVEFTGKFGFLNDKGKEIFAPQFDVVLDIFHKYAIVGNGRSKLNFTNWPEGKNFIFNGYMGLVSTSGDHLIPIEFTNISPVYAEEEILWQAMDDNGNLQLFNENIEIGIPENIEEISDFHSNRSRIRINDKYGFINLKGEPVIPIDFDNATHFNEDIAFIQKNSRYFHIDTMGVFQDDKLQFEIINNPSEGLSLVRIFNMYGFINQDSVFIHYPEYAEALPFFNGIAPVRNKDYYGYCLIDGSKDLAKNNSEKILVDIGDLIDLSHFPRDSFNIAASNNSVSSGSDTWYLSFRTLTNHLLGSVLLAPKSYYQYPEMLPKVCSGEGTLAGRYEFGHESISSGNPIWEMFKKQVLLKIIDSKKLREKSFEWFMPYVRNAFARMPRLHKQVYKDMLDYLDNYYRNYQLDKVADQLINNEPEFAYQHWDGSKSPYRKVSAQIDRLILVYEVINAKEVDTLIKNARKEIFEK